MEIKSKTDKRRIGIMGGTFDPIHHGHLVAASEVQHRFNLDEVVFVPTYTQPFKTRQNATDPEHRYLMANVATASNPRFSVSRVDIDRKGVTYTVDTLREIRKEYGEVELYFITGADALSRLEEWKDCEELLTMAHFVGVTRPGHRLEGKLLEKAQVIEIPALAISATEIRERVRQGAPVWYLVPDGVVQYIAKYGIYQD